VRVNGIALWFEAEEEVILHQFVEENRNVEA
jgi:hypothetical protein